MSIYIYVFRIQETDGGFFENFGSLLAEKARAQEEAEGPLPKRKDEMQEEEDTMSEEGSIDEPTEALLETDSDRDENEHARNFLAESMGLNVSIESCKIITKEMSQSIKLDDFFILNKNWHIHVHAKCSIIILTSCNTNNIIMK